jgi:EpsG family
LLPYWLLLSVFAAGSIEYRRRGLIGTGSAPLLALAGLATALMIGLRFEVGGDWFNYIDIYNDFLYADFATSIARTDPGYALVSWVSVKLGYEIWFVNLVCGLIFSWGLIKFARRQANPWLAVLVAVPYLVIVVAMGYTRQGVAIGFILAGLSNVDRQSLGRFAVYVILAATFHKSAVIVLPLVALAATKQRVVTVGILIVTAALLYYLLVSDNVDRLMRVYVESGYGSEGAAIRVSMNLPPAFIFLMWQRRFGLPEQQRLLWRNFCIAAWIALLLLWRINASTAIDRIALYLIPLQMFVLARMPEAFGGRTGNKQLAILVILYSALIQFVWLNYAAHSEYWLPYQLYPLNVW